MQFPSQDFTNQFISSSYQDVVQIYNQYLLDGLGNVIPLLNITASHVASGGSSNLDGGFPNSVYGGTTNIDGGVP